MPGELLSKKLTRGERGDVSLSGPRYSAAGDPRGEHGYTACSFGKFTSSESALHAVSRLPWRPLSTRSPALVDAQPPRRRAAAPSSMRSPALASSSFISRGRRALSFSYLSTLLLSDRSLSGFLHSPFVAGFFRAFMKVCTPTNTRKQEKRSSPSVGEI